MSLTEGKVITKDNLKSILEKDTYVKVAGIDVDGILRGKIISKEKFLSAVTSGGFGFCSVIFGWDMHDKTYHPITITSAISSKNKNLTPDNEDGDEVTSLSPSSNSTLSSSSSSSSSPPSLSSRQIKKPRIQTKTELGISNAQNGYRDILAIPDLSSYRRIPWEKTLSSCNKYNDDDDDCDVESNNKSSSSTSHLPFFLVHFFDPDTKLPIAPDPRSLLKTIVESYKDLNSTNNNNDDDEDDPFSITAMPYAGMEFEFFQFKETQQSLYKKHGLDLEPLTPGMFGYSISRLGLNLDYQAQMLATCAKFDVNLEGWHTETGPGVFETAIGYCPATKLADKATLFKLCARTVGAQYGIMPCFMAKPRQGLPGNSGHIHVSLISSKDGINLFGRTTPDPSPEWPDIKHLSDIGRHFLAGVLEGMPDIMPILAPNVNSYKRLVENFWAPVTVSWGLEHRVASIRLIAPPLASLQSTRFEIRTPGADVEPHLALAAIFALGLRGIRNRLPLKIPPMGHFNNNKEKEDEDILNKFDRLPRSLRLATERFMRPDSIARKVLGNEFVDHYGATRLHECKEFEDCVTNWEVERYMETI